MKKAELEAYKDAEGPIGEYCRGILLCLDDIENAKRKLVDFLNSYGCGVTYDMSLRDIARSGRIEKLERLILEKTGV